MSDHTNRLDSTATGTTIPSPITSPVAVRSPPPNGRLSRRRLNPPSASRRRVPVSEVDRLRVGRSGGHDHSARNRFSGVVREIKVEGLLAQVELEAGPFRVVAVITREAVEALGLREGMAATALVKATSVMVER